jgi:hypothetical protein
MLHIPTPEEDRLRQQIAAAELRGQIITDATAHDLAVWLAGTAGPGFNAFVTTALVTADLYTELTRLYDVRRAESERWLDALTRYLVHQPRHGSGQGVQPPKAGRP